MAMVTAIVKRPDELVGHMTNVSDRLETMQTTVGGYIETVTLDRQVVIVCNEEGIIKGLDPNCAVCGIPFYGTIVAIGYDNKGNFSDIPIKMPEWRERYLKMRKIGG